MDTIKEIESIRTDILDTIAKCECGDDCESVVYLKKIAGRLSSVSSCCRPLAAAPAASPTPDGAAPSASVPSVPSVPSNTAKLREALDLVDEGFTEGCLDAPGDCPTKHDLHRVSVIREKVKSALAAPPRNCERFQTKDAAREAFQKLRHHRVWADVSLWDDRDEIEAFLDWLFATGDNCLKCPFSEPTCKFAWAQAPYVEKEGGAK